MDFFDTDITNPFFAGYAFECDANFEFQKSIERIVARCGTVIEASALTNELCKEGIDPQNLSSQQMEVIDNTFDCY